MKKVLDRIIIVFLIIFLLLAGVIGVLQFSGYMNSRKKVQAPVYFSVLGDSISAYEGYIPEDATPFYDASMLDVSQMWWNVMAQQTGMTPCVINASGGTGVTELIDEDGSSTAGNSERCEQLGNGDCVPDVIFVLLGGNDYRRGRDLTWLEASYVEMVERMKRAYPEADLYLCTYFPVKGLGGKDLERLNKIIARVSQVTAVGLIDTSFCGITLENSADYIIDSAKEGIHPNDKGQKLLGQCIAHKYMEIKNNSNKK